MAIERGLPAIPRGLPRELYFYLQSLQAVVTRLGGLGRGTAATRAVRASEAAQLQAGKAAKAEPDNGSILAGHIAPCAVTEAALEDACVTAAKIAASAVGGDRLAPEGIDSAALKKCCVTREKLATELVPVFLQGTAEDGETVRLGKWLERPLVCLTGMNVPLGMCGELAYGIREMREEDGEWLFEAEAVFLMDGDRRYPGSLEWLAAGWRRE